MRSVYIHIPFCSNICSYCDFAKVYYNNNIVEKYLKSLSNEVSKRYKNNLINTLYIGGGTPSSLSIENLSVLFKIINKLNLTKDCEITFECNIDDTTYDKLLFLYNNNVNRLSFGIQSFNPKLLKILNRTHTKEDIYRVINMAKEIGFKNINVDLIYGINKETINDVKEELDNFLSLNINHISTYALIIEPNTILSNNNYKNINEDTEYKMYKYINKTLTKNNYTNYEFANYAKDNTYSKHNLVYWNNLEYYGFGLGAVSYLNKRRITNTRNLTTYLKNKYIYTNIYEDKNTTMSNEMILGLRKIQGVNEDEFYKKYNLKIEDVFDINKLLQNRLLIKEKGYLKINKDYLYLSNEILVNFII